MMARRSECFCPEYAYKFRTMSKLISDLKPMIVRYWWQFSMISYEIVGPRRPRPTV